MDQLDFLSTEDYCILIHRSWVHGFERLCSPSYLDLKFTRWAQLQAESYPDLQWQSRIHIHGFQPHHRTSLQAHWHLLPQNLWVGRERQSGVIFHWWCWESCRSLHQELTTWEIHKVQSSIGLTVSLWQLLVPLCFSALHAAQQVGVLKTQSMSRDKYIDNCTAGTFNQISVMQSLT